MPRIKSINILTMLNFLVGWVGSAKSGLLVENQVSLPDHVCIAEYLNPTPNLTLSTYSRLSNTSQQTG
jgi:hypothetical protein